MISAAALIAGSQVVYGAAPSDRDAAVSVVRAAAKAGDKEAQFELARRLEEGRDVAVDLRAALRWYVRAGSATRAPSVAYSAPLGRFGGSMTILGSSVVRPGIPEAVAQANRLRAILRAAGNHQNDIGERR